MKKRAQKESKIEPWRDSMSPEELAKYERGGYNNSAPMPWESQPISHDNRLVSLKDTEVPDRGMPTPEDNALSSEYERGLDQIFRRPQPCVQCCRNLQAREGKSVILKFDIGGGLPQGATYCLACWDALGLGLEPDPWLASEPVLHQRVWALISQGLTEQEIAAKLTTSNRRITQQMVSNIKLKIVQHARETRRSRRK